MRVTISLLVEERDVNSLRAASQPRKGARGVMSKLLLLLPLSTYLYTADDAVEQTGKEQRGLDSTTTDSCLRAAKSRPLGAVLAYIPCRKAVY